MQEFIRNFPKIGFGTADLGEMAENAVLEALKCGYRLIDTARSYDSEDAVGKALMKAYAEIGLKRSDIIIQTKLSPSADGYYSVLNDFEQSLNQLRCDYVDVYLIHWPVNRGRELDYHEKNIEIWQAFEQLYKSGKVRVLGVCNFLERHLLDILDHCIYPPVLHQLELHPGFQQRGLVEFSRKKGMSIEAWSPFGRGELDHAEYNRIAQKYHKNIGQLALRWSIQNGYIPLTRSGNAEHIAGNIEVFDFSISEEEMKLMNELNSEHKHLDIWSYRRQQMY